MNSSNHSLLAPLAALLALTGGLFGAACSSGEGDAAGSGGTLGAGASAGTATGAPTGAPTGDPTGTATGAATGTATGAATGTATGAATGTATGGGAAFTCDAGVTGVPDLIGKTAGTVGTPDALDVNGGDQFRLEGPVWANGALYLSQFRKWGALPPSQILKLEGTSFTPHILDSGTNGLAVDGDGLLVAASHKAQQVVRFGADNMPTNISMGSFNSPNDLTLRADGNIYFTDPKWQCDTTCPAVAVNAYRVPAGGGAAEAINPPHTNPNGIALSPDGNTLYISGDSQGIKSYPVDADGKVGTQADFAPITGVDGMTVDCAGNLYAAINGQSRIDVYKPDGMLHGSIAVGSAPTNVAFGGAARTTLYITMDDGSLKSVELDIPGYPY